MNSDRWAQIDSLCHAVLERQPADQQAFLRGACAGDEELRREVESLLAGQTQAERFLETPAAPVPLERLPVEARTSEPLLSPGTRVGPYEVVALVGAGGMGEVYKAHDTRLDRTVALKVLPPDLAIDPGWLTRFKQEARSVAALNHPNICALHDIGEAPIALPASRHPDSGDHSGPVAVTYLVMEYLDGASLSARLERGPLPIDQAVDIGLQVAKGLAAAHARRIVHRDVKPANVFLTSDGQVKLLDFGIAKLVQAESDDDLTSPPTRPAALTSAGGRLGTVGYMAPEQVAGLPCDHRADIFAFGCLFYELLSGRRAFKGTTAADTLAAIRTADAPRLVGLDGERMPKLQAVVDRCLKKRPEDRFPSARDLALALEGISRGNTARGNASRLLARVALSIRAHRRLWTLGCLFVVAGITAASIQGWRHFWVRSQAVPELVRLADAGENWPAFLLARRLEAIVPGEATVEKLRPRFGGETRRQFRPVGATLLARPRTGVDTEWVELGQVGQRPLAAPLGDSVFRLQASGYEPREFAMNVSSFGFDTLRIQGVLALPRSGEAPPGMVLIETPPTGARLFALSPLCPLTLVEEGRIGTFFVDTREVTNREFKRFVDAGGYQLREYWTEPFGRDGKRVTWNEAMAGFRDSTGRPGPAGWRFGAYEPGTEELPVTGVSWFEASAYAAFVGKRLPSVYHQAVASARFVGGDTLPGSNFSGKLAPVGTYRGSLNYWGLYDTAGNAREWCSNVSGQQRFALGGAADGPAYMFWNVEDNARSAFDRAAMTGFRCVKTVASNLPDPKLDEPLQRKSLTDWSKVQGFSDDTWKTWQGLLSYSKGQLDERVEWKDDAIPTRRIEKVTFAATEPHERVTVYLFLPDGHKYPPPWQPVIFIHPGFGSAVSSSQDGHNTMDTGFWDYLVKDGRAVVYPVFKGVFERGGGPQNSGDFTWSTWQQRAKDVFRTIDYLQTRGDIRADRLGLLAASGGADGGIVVSAADPRIKAAVLVGGGMYGDPSTDREMIGFASRIWVPLQMVSGRSDNWGQEVLLASLATPSSRKRFIQFDGDHSLAGFEKDVIRVNLEWFDRYLGPPR
jgi:serine/threonine protein kinase/dienelactone hydrolase